MDRRDRAELPKPPPQLGLQLEAGLALIGNKTEKLIVPRALLAAGEPKKARRVVTHRGPSQWGTFWGKVSGCLSGVGPDLTAPRITQYQ